MKLAILIAFLTVVLPAASTAKEVVLKSGARGTLTASVIEATAKFGGPSAGNAIGLSLKVTSKRRARPEVDANSLCQLYGQSSYTRMQTDDAFLAAASKFIDMSAPLVAVRVSFFHGDAGPISIGRHFDFDMRGVVKCRPNR